MHPTSSTNPPFSSCPPPSCHLDCCCLIPLLSTLCPHCILSPPTYGPGLHPSSEERPSSWSLLQLWQTRPHCEGLPRTTCPECLEHQCYDDSETRSRGLAVPCGIPEGDSNSVHAHNAST